MAVPDWAFSQMQFPYSLDYPISFHENRGKYPKANQ
jgi:hypothetical protein